jgi:hypothetical protein
MHPRNGKEQSNSVILSEAKNLMPLMNFSPPYNLTINNPLI